MHPPQKSCCKKLSHFVFDRFEWIRKLIGGPKMIIIYLDPSKIIWTDHQFVILDCYFYIHLLFKKKIIFG
jgi:hypothetical protein